MSLREECSTWLYHHEVVAGSDPFTLDDADQPATANCQPGKGELQLAASVLEGEEPPGCRQGWHQKETAAASRA